MEKTQDAKIVDLAIRLLFLGLFLYSALVMVAPLASVVIWATILCVALYPAFDWLQSKLGGTEEAGNDDPGFAGSGSHIGAGRNGGIWGRGTGVRVCRAS